MASKCWKLEKQGRNLPYRFQREPGPAAALILNFRPLELQDGTFLLFLATKLAVLFTAVLGNKYKRGFGQ